MILFVARTEDRLRTSKRALDAILLARIRIIDGVVPMSEMETRTGPSLHRSSVPIFHRQSEAALVKENIDFERKR